MLAISALGGFFSLVIALVILLTTSGGNQVGGRWPAGGSPGGGGTSAGTSSNWGSGRAGKLLGTLERGPMVATILAGSGAGNGVARFSKTYMGAPFPLRAGAVVTFELFFHPGFEWSCRGKIGGLYIGTGKASGGNYSTNGASHRLMWESEGDAFSYVYVPSGTQARQPPALSSVRQYGQGVFESDFKRALATNQWNKIELGVRLNGVGQTDGQLLLGVNGKVRVLSGVTWRTSALDIRAFHINVFHGGGCSATRQSKVSFRNIEVHDWSV